MNEGKNQSSLRSFVADYLKSPGPAGPQGQSASILEQKPKSPNPELGGLDKNKGQAILGFDKDDYDEAEKIAKGIKNFVNEQGETKIIIENHTSKVLKFFAKDLKEKGQATWVTEPPTKIAAGGKDFMVVKTDMWLRGKTRADTSGWAMYEIAGKDEKDKTGKIHISWARKGDKGLAKTDDWDTSGAPRIEVTARQTTTGEITFYVDETPDTTPKDDGKDSKSAPVADAFVLFPLNDAKTLDAKGESAIHTFAIAYQGAQSTAKIYVSGYASKEGPEENNEKLSFNRAKKVFEILSTDGNLPSGVKILWDGFKTTGDFGKDDKDLPPNRRVTISLTPPKGTAASVPDPKAKEPQSPADPKAKPTQSRDHEEPPKRPLNPASASKTGP